MRPRKKTTDETVRVNVSKDTLIERMLHQKRFLEEQALDHWLTHRKRPCSRDFEFGSWLAKCNAAAAIAIEMDLACWSWQRETAESKIKEAAKYPNCLDYFRKHYPTFNFDDLGRESVASTGRKDPIVLEAVAA